MLRIGPLAGVLHLQRALLGLHVQAHRVSTRTQVYLHLFDLRERSLAIALQFPHLLLLLMKPTQVFLADRSVILAGLDLVKADVVHQPPVYLRLLFLCVIPRLDDLGRVLNHLL